MRVLHILNGLRFGGCESYIMNMYRNINRDKIQFDFLIRSKDNFYADEIGQLGGKIYYTPEFPRHFIKNWRSVNDFFKNHKEYDIIHMHFNSLIYLFPLIIGKKYGIKNRVVHSHNSMTLNKIARCIHKLNRFFVGIWATNYIACSQKAGEWAYISNNYVVMKNGIDTGKFQYNKELREGIRKRLGLCNNEIVIGNVGSLTSVKNQKFLLTILKKIRENDERYRLILVGDGPDRESIQELLVQYELQKYVIITGGVERPDIYYQAMDLFAFPSLYEGFPIAFMEAQCSGLPCLISDTITDDAVLTPDVYRLSITDEKGWVDQIRQVVSGEKMDKRCSAAQILIEHGYDIHQSASIMERYYMDMHNSK